MQYKFVNFFLKLLIISIIFVSCSEMKSFIFKIKESINQYDTEYAKGYKNGFKEGRLKGFKDGWNDRQNQGFYCIECNDVRFEYKH